ncbi:MAG TPA: alpha/beta hydrolase [Oceanithermus profundus]|uniref:Maspardin n=1 Tax=Oceanithermus profundus TaxID=187137 RepID=A0A7C4ZHN5_9DEIN|nr:alpha/beta hydrolase [Oceanithermus profundus]
MSRIWLAFLGLLALLALALYFWPTPQASFEELAADVPAADRERLLAFRAAHPPKRLRVDGLDWEYVAFGTGPQAVLFLHGTTGAYDIWWRQLEALSDRFRVVSVTYPPAAGLAGLARGVLAVLEHERISHAHVVGSSLGGYLAQYLLARYPSYIDRLVLGNTFPPNDLLREKHGRLVRILPFLPEWVVMKTLAQTFRTSLYEASGRSRLLRAYLLDQASGRMSKAQVIARARANLEPFETVDPETVGVEVLILESDNDPLVPAELRARLKATYPQARVRTLQGAGHFPYVNRAEEYTAHLRVFLER